MTLEKRLHVNADPVIEVKDIDRYVDLFKGMSNKIFKIKKETYNNGDNNLVSGEVDLNHSNLFSNPTKGKLTFRVEKEPFMGNVRLMHIRYNYFTLENEYVDLDNIYSTMDGLTQIAIMAQSRDRLPRRIIEKRIHIKSDLSIIKVDSDYTNNLKKRLIKEFSLSDIKNNIDDILISGKITGLRDDLAINSRNMNLKFILERSTDFSGSPFHIRYDYISKENTKPDIKKIYSIFDKIQSSTVEAENMW